MAKGGTIEYGVKFAVDKTELDNRIKELSAITTWCGSKKYRNIKVAS